MDCGLIPAPTTLPTRLSTAAATQGLFRAYQPARRAAVVAQVFDADFLATVTDAELQTLRRVYRDRDEHGMAPGLGHVVARFAEQRLADRPAGVQP